MLRKKEIFTIITPIPGFIPRQLAIDILHSHSEVITLNPLVLSHRPIAAPQNAETDEYYSTWYEITERIQFVPGIGKMGASTIKFNGCFHNMPWGLQTHIYAPMNVDLRNKYRIAGNQQGYEAPEQQEMGLKALGAPTDGLYLKEDIEIKCNITMVSFVKAQLQKAGGEMVQRIIKKAELLDAGVLQAMIEDGKLKTINPADRSNTGVPSPLPSPVGLHHSPSVASTATPPPLSPRMPYQVPRPQSYQNQGFRPSTPGSAHPYNPHGVSVYGAPSPYANQYPEQSGPMELPGHHYHQPPATSAPIEMPGDFYYGPVNPQQTSTPPPSNRESTKSAASGGPQASPDPSQSGRWSHADSRPTSVASTATGASGPLGSPGMDHKGFASELSTHKETPEEHRGEALRKLDPRIPQPAHFPPYNPQDYANVVHQQKQMMHANNGQQGQYNYGH